MAERLLSVEDYATRLRARQEEWARSLSYETGPPFALQRRGVSLEVILQPLAAARRLQPLSNGVPMSSEAADIETNLDILWSRIAPNWQLEACGCFRHRTSNSQKRSEPRVVTGLGRN